MPTKYSQIRQKQMIWWKNLETIHNYFDFEKIPVRVLEETKMAWLYVNHSQQHNLSCRKGSLLQVLILVHNLIDSFQFNIKFLHYWYRYHKVYINFLWRQLHARITRILLQGEKCWNINWNQKKYDKPHKQWDQKGTHQHFCQIFHLCRTPVPCINLE